MEYIPESEDIKFKAENILTSSQNITHCNNYTYVDSLNLNISRPIYLHKGEENKIHDGLKESM